ncbi:solute carrier family 25 member 35-like [Hyposmocoma kahamanoa]|uniref:solute carrier family 25 member 35-like n=1 Tax=Hyposmocoma kahamanoa TaxID=1477025 RepID=UPI000E6D8154|nr:solute carrier family 25 member 35-like [Hyposmocoma kahamanoa]
MDFVIGGLAGAGATVFTNPLDVVKTRLQLQGELRARSKHTVQYRGIFNGLYVIAKNDGLLALQKGLVPAMFFGFAMNSVRLGLYHIAETNKWIMHKEGNISMPKAAFWGSVSGYLSGIAATPLSVVKTRLQSASHPSIAVGRQYRYTGMKHAVVSIYNKEGMKGFFAGLNATCTRLFIGSAAQLTTFSTSKEFLLNNGICVNTPLGLAFLASLLSAVVVSLAICPLDVATVRLYNQGPAKRGVVLYNGLFDCVAKIYRIEGLHGLYKGLGPLYLRLAPHTTLSLVIWDMLNNILLHNKNS